MLFLAVIREPPLLIAAYCAAYCASICTLVQNIFLTPVTFPVLQGQWQPFPSQSASLAACLMIVGLVRVICYYYIYRAVPLDVIGNIEPMRVAMLAVVTSISVFIRKIQTPMNGSLFLPEISFYLILLQISMLLYLVLFERYRRNLRETTAYRMQQTTTEALMHSIQLRKARDEEVRSLRHDLKNHMHTLQHLVRKNQNAEADRYISDFLGRVGEQEFHPQTGSDMLDALLGEKMWTAGQENIEFVAIVNFTKGGFLSDFDLCTIMGNALDNAIEACRLVPEGNRFIEFKGGPVADHLLIRIVNSTIAATSIGEGLPITTKLDRDSHGFGLRNVKRTVEKYCGSIDTKVQDGKFILTLLFPFPDAQSQRAD